MSEYRYPTIKVEIVTRFVIETGRLDENGIQIQENLVRYIIAGPQAIFKRTMEIKLSEPGYFTFEQAMSIALRLKFVPKMVDWFEIHRNWKDGAYFNRPKTK